MPNSGDLAKAAAFWDNLADQYFKDEITRREEWQSHPAAIARRVRLLGDRDSLGWLADRIVQPIDRALGAGCGVASFELELLNRGCVGHYDLYDVSGASLEAASDRARALGLEDRITIHCGDLGSADRDDYGLVTFISSLHHAVDVPATVGFVRDILAPRGLLFADEYVGPRRFDYPPEHSDLVKALYRSLAAELRGPWVELPQPDPAEVAAVDPTEAAQSDLIVDVMRASFADVEVAPVFGALPFILWWGLDHDVMWDTEAGREFAAVLMALDTAMGLSGALPSYFSVVLARKG